MKIVFVHQSFPEQFRHLAPALIAQGHEVATICIGHAPGIASVRTERYSLAKGNTPGVHPWAAEFETKMLRGEGAARARNC